MIQNPFNNPAFEMAELTKAINLLPNNYGRLREMKIMPVKGVRSRTVIVEMKNGILTLLPTKPVGSPGTVHKMAKRNVRSFVVPHIPHDADILPEEYDGLRSFGSEDDMVALSQLMNDKLQSMRVNHGITLEHLRMGALKGEILDSDGSVIYNLYDEFNITPFDVDFELSDVDTDVKQKCIDLLRHMEDNLLGEAMRGVHVLVSQEFFDALVDHPKVREAYERWRDGELLRTDMREGFNFAGVTFEEYRGRSLDIEGNTRRFIAASEGHAFPMGTLNTFETLVAPADFIETTNTIGQLLYAKQEERKFGRGIDIHTQSNPLPICYRPAVLVKVLTS